MDKFIDKIRLGSGMSLMIGNTPSKLDVGIIGIGKPALQVEKFGLFESATPNFETYYPDVKNAADIKPDEGDFITPTFRMLSEVIVRKSYNPVDFSMNGVLKKSMSKLLGQTIYPNHEALVGNELGTVAEVFWQNSYKTSNGIIVPAGINGIFKIDTKSHPNVARKILMEPPAIHSNSVTVEFEWERSHPKMDMDEFRSKIGTMGTDGQLVRRIATDIRNYHETSLVAHGADPFAQVIDGKNEINNAEYADSVYSLSAQGKEKPRYYVFNYREDLLSLNEEQPQRELIKPENNNNMKKITLLASQLALIALFGAKLEAGKESVEVELTDENLKKLDDMAKLATSNQEASTQLSTANSKVTELTNEVKAKGEEVTRLTAELAAEKSAKDALKTKVDGNLTSLRAEVKRVYTALKADKVDSAILTNIDNADEALLNSLSKTYNEELEAKFPSKCTDCGSHNISKASAQLGEPPVGGNKEIKILSDKEVEDAFLSETKAGFILDKKA